MRDDETVCLQFINGKPIGLSDLVILTIDCEYFLTNQQTLALDYIFSNLVKFQSSFTIVSLQSLI